MSKRDKYSDDATQEELFGRLTQRKISIRKSKRKKSKRRKSKRKKSKRKKSKRRVYKNKIMKGGMDAPKASASASASAVDDEAKAPPASGAATSPAARAAAASPDAASSSSEKIIILESENQDIRGAKLTVNEVNKTVILEYEKEGDLIHSLLDSENVEFNIKNNTITYIFKKQEEVIHNGEIVGHLGGIEFIFKAEYEEAILIAGKILKTEKPSPEKTGFLSWFGI
jgi:hypothetical protein